ncbi:MAG: hypothetical protein E6K80_07155 [Candidatus Eisenbacteria bacterium]|uniref:Uncharacterized protein n=1 Tax=Eiseniibacteriota bacterium TaxID=2212470 RepID=A0A538U4Q5_UNCEI|nr:MAG: hypothetical protein E6K80_07155 [Candidatus Eisenbacteria bacterium]
MASALSGAPALKPSPSRKAIGAISTISAQERRFFASSARVGRSGPTPRIVTRRIRPAPSSVSAAVTSVSSTIGKAIRSPKGTPTRRTVHPNRDNEPR